MGAQKTMTGFMLVWSSHFQDRSFGTNFVYE